MNRMTRISQDGLGFRLERSQLTLDQDGYSGEAIERLAIFENVYLALLAEQERLTALLDRLREEDKTKSVQFREALGQKLTNSRLIILLESHGLK